MGKGKEREGTVTSRERRRKKATEKKKTPQTNLQKREQCERKRQQRQAVRERGEKKAAERRAREDEERKGREAEERWNRRIQMLTETDDVTRQEIDSSDRYALLSSDPWDCRRDQKMFSSWVVSWFSRLSKGVLVEE